MSEKYKLINADEARQLAKENHSEEFINEVLDIINERILVMAKKNNMSTRITVNKERIKHNGRYNTHNFDKIKEILEQNGYKVDYDMIGPTVGYEEEYTSIRINWE